MRNFAVKITEILEETVYIDAETQADAEELVEAAWNDGEYVLGAENFVVATFDAMESNVV